MRIFLLAAAASLVAIPVPAHAWKARGHMAVAAVAWCHMSKSARVRASELLKLNPDRDSWIAATRDDLKDQAAFIAASTWPDKIRGSYQDDGYEPHDPIASQNIGYADHYVHSYWHFMDIPFSQDGTRTKAPPPQNAVRQIQIFYEVLRASTPPSGVTSAQLEDMKSYDLAWLIHLVGDMHQPLHATSRFSSATKHGDNGGNSVKVCLPNARLCDLKHASNLHTLWDAAVGTSQSVPGVITMVQTFKPFPNDQLGDLDPDHWAAYSQKLAEHYAYVGPIKGGRGPYTVTLTYRNKVGSIAQSQIAKGGVRLATMLNAAFDPGATTDSTPGRCVPD